MKRLNDRSDDSQTVQDFVTKELHSLDAGLRLLHSALLSQPVSAQSLRHSAEAFLALAIVDARAQLDQEQTPDSHAQPERQQGQMLPLSDASPLSTTIDQPCTHHRLKWLLSKCLSALKWVCMITIWYLVLFGRPQLIAEGLYEGGYQLLVFGADSRCEDPYKCEGAAKDGVLGWLAR